jgi:hypothetical protein
MARWIALAVVSTLLSVAVVGCGLGVTMSTPGTVNQAPSPSPPAGLASTPSLSSAPAAVRADSQEGPFRLTFELPKDTWSADENIQGLATLSLVDGTVTDVGGSRSLFAFDFAEVGGSRHMDAAWTLECGPHHLVAGAPLTSPITKSGGFSADDPNAAFYRAFLAGPDTHLPAGDWTITAVAPFAEGSQCQGQDHTLRAGIRIHVLPGPAVQSPSPSE